FALFMAGLDFVMLAIAVWWVDGLGHRQAVKPLVILGMNAIAVYMTSEILDGMLHTIQLSSGVSAHVWIYNRVFAPLASPMNASLMYAVTYTLTANEYETVLDYLSNHLGLKQ